MNTAVVQEDGKLSLITKSMPKISDPNDVIIQVTHSGVCGTDLSIIAGKFPAAKKIIQGHEFAGVISEIGPSVKFFKVGDRVCVNPYDYCSHCYYCVRGQTQFCVTDGMKTAIGYMKDGGFQQYTNVPSHLCTILPDDMPLQQSVFCQPLSTIIRGWDNMGKVTEDSKILIGGAGIIGILWASLFHYHGYRDVTISEISEHRKEMAGRLDLGFPSVHPKELGDQYEEAQKNGDEIWGFDVIVDCTGNMKAVEAEFKWLRKGATYVLFGVCGQGVEVHFEPFQLYKKEITIVSSYLNRFCFARTVELVHNMSERYLSFKHLDVGTYKIQDYEAAMEALRKGEISKAVFQF